MIIIVFLTVSMSIALMSQPFGPYGIIPGGSSAPAGLHIFWVFMWFVLSPIIGIFAFGYVLSPLFLLIHKIAIGKKMVYGIQNKAKPDTFKRKYRSLFPALMAINFAFMLIDNEGFVNIVLSSEWIEHTMDVNSPAVATSILSMVALFGTICFTIGVAMAIFSPAWFLIDGGIVYTNQEKVKEDNVPTEVRSVGSWYIYLLKGYAGIGVIIGYYNYIVDTLATQTEGPGLILVPVLPILLIIFSIPAVVLFEMTYKHRKKFMLFWAKKLGVSKNVSVSFNEIT